MSGLCPQRLFQQSAGVADRVAPTTMPTFNIHITSPAPKLQHLPVSFTPAFPLQAAHSPLKKPNQAARRPSPWFHAKPARGPYGFSRRWRHAQRRNGTPCTGASPADLDSVGTAATPAQLAAGSMEVEQAFTVPSSVGDGPEGAPGPDRLSNPINLSARRL